MSSMPDMDDSKHIIADPRHLAHVWVVTPTGKFYPARTEPNVSDQVVKMEQGRPQILPRAEEAGYVFLSKVCASPEYYEALVEELDRSMLNATDEPLDTRFIPAICLERRAANKSKRRQVDRSKLAAALAAAGGQEEAQEEAPKVHMGPKVLKSPKTGDK